MIIMNEGELQAELELERRRNEHLKDDVLKLDSAIRDAIKYLQEIKLYSAKTIRKYINGEADNEEGYSRGSKRLH